MEALSNTGRGGPHTGSPGRLKIFFGYAAGVGKTYAMLEAAHQAQKEGLDVVVGYVEPHARPDTLALLDGLEVLPCKEIDYHGVKLKELDLDRALQRKPQLILVDELAHSNAQGCRHTKRYQDVEELLQAGINVYTTVNVQHLESLNDLVSSITGIAVNERIPDHVFDRANQVELVDIEPDELKLTALAIIIHPLLILAFSALAVATAAGRAGITNPGFHGLSQVLYEYASSAANNGSGFEGLADNSSFWNITTGIVMFLGRYLPIVIQLAIAGSLMKKNDVNESAGTLRTGTVSFAVILVFVVYIFAALTFFPALALGPIAEHLTLWG